MSIDEAVEKYRNERTVDIATARGALSVLAQAYLDLTDPTPLTVELIEKELGPADRFGQWKVADSYIGWNTPFKCGNVNGHTFTTLGHLRQIVAMLRGGGK